MDALDLLLPAVILATTFVTLFTFAVTATFTVAFAFAFAFARSLTFALRYSRPSDAGGTHDYCGAQRGRRAEEDADCLGRPLPRRFGH